MKHDYIERSDAGFNGWQQNFMQAVIINYRSWGINPADEATLIALQSNWLAAYSTGGKLMDATRNKMLVQTKNDARKEYEVALRQFVKQWIKYNSLITDAQKLSMGVTVNKTTQAPVQVPDTAPEVHLTAASGSQLMVDFGQMPNTETSLPQQRSSNRKGKPKGYRSLRLYYTLGNVAPTDVSACNSMMGLTKRGQKLRFSPADAGKRIYLYACWVNTKEQEGPLTKLISAVIPS